MISHPKKPRGMSKRTRDLLAIVDDYSKSTGDLEPNLYKVAKLAIESGQMGQPKVDPVRVAARILATACRQDYVEDENGEPVRRRHAIKIEAGAEQLTLWPKMENMTPGKFRVSLTSRRNGTVQDSLQTERDRRYFNKHYNPGDPIEIEWNLTADIEEHFMPTDYPDTPPEQDGQPEE
ncbi:MAG TPA: hypothetical protein VFE46_12615 [Pirellulales bacterium]|jgi:hypothetical protein|nr:hypothetical protein [Pirellulales bacterium]